MDGEVFKEAYEIVGDGIAIAEAYYAERDAAVENQWTGLKALGADGFRPGHNGAIRSLFFKEPVPDGWRKIGREAGLVECVPHKGTKVGKEAAKALEALPRAPIDRVLIDQFGWAGRMPIYGGRIFSATVTRLELPRVRYLLRLPRQLGDGFLAPSTLTPIPMADYLKAFDDHNEAVRGQEAA